MTNLHESLNSSHIKLESDTIYLQRKLEFLKEKIGTLQQICKTIDPYSPLDEETSESLKIYGVTNLDDPFQVTNQLVVQLENSIEELEQIELQLESEDTTRTIQ
jgi:hypothetical protein